MSEKWSVPVTVIVSGEPHTVRAERLRTVQVFINRALDGAKVPTYSRLGHWELRDMDGVLLDPGVKVRDAAAIKAGATLYLNPRAGVGA